MMTEVFYLNPVQKLLRFILSIRFFIRPALAFNILNKTDAVLF